MSNLYETNNTFSKKPSPAQIASYIIFTTETVIFYTLILTNIQLQASMIAMMILFTITLLMLIITTVITGFIDPSDSIMIQYRNGSQSKKKEINNLTSLLYCQHCRSYVQQQSRHCRVCNRCTSNFDHHCIWINSCIGSANYLCFFIMICSVFLNLGAYMIGAILLITQNNFFTFLASFIAVEVVAGIILIFWILDLNLIILHIYLAYKGITTYQFIITQRIQAERQERKNQQQQSNKKSIQMLKIKGQKSDQKGQNTSNQDNNIESSQNNIIVNNKQKFNQQQLKQKINVRNKSSEKTINDNYYHQNIQLHTNQDLNGNNNKMIKIQSSNQSSNNKKNNQNKSIIFDHDNDTSSKQISDAQQLQSQKIDEDSVSCLKISQFFTKNKSFKLIIGDNQFIRPHQSRIGQIQERVESVNNNGFQNTKKKQSNIYLSQ